MIVAPYSSPAARASPSPSPSSRIYYLFVFYFFLGISGSIYEFSMRKDLQDYGLSLPEINYQVMFPMLPWGFKFVFAAISDNIRCCGYNYKPYLLGSNLLASIGCLLLMLRDLQLGQYMLILFLLQLFGVWADVMYDSMMIVEANLEPNELKGVLQNRISMFRTLGRIVGKCSQAPLWQQVGSGGVFGIMTICYVVSLLLSICVSDSKPSFYRPSKYSVGIQIDENGNDLKAPKYEEQVQREVSLGKIYCWGLGVIRKSLQNPYLQAPLIFTIFTGMLPDASLPLFFFLNDVIKMPTWQLSLLSLTAEIAQLIMLVMFEYGLRKINIRAIYGIIVVLKVIVGMLPYPLAAPAKNPAACPAREFNSTIGNVTCRMYEEDHLQPFVLAMGDNAIGSALDELQSLPLQIITAIVCNHALGPTVYTLTLSLQNLAFGAKIFINSCMLGFFGLDHGQFYALPAYLIFCTTLDAFSAFIILFFFPNKTLKEIKEEVEEERREEALTAEYVQTELKSKILDVSAQGDEVVL